MCVPPVSHVLLSSSTGIFQLLVQKKFAHRWAQPTCAYFKILSSRVSVIPNPYPLDLRWRIVWLSFTQQCSAILISQLLHLSECTVRWYITMFHQLGDVEPIQHRHDPLRLLDELEQLTLLQIVLQNPRIYLDEIQTKVRDIFGILNRGMTG